MKNVSQNADHSISSDLRVTLKDFEDKWVVLSPDNSKVLASGDSFESIVDFLADGFAMKVPHFVAFIRCI